MRLPCESNQISGWYPQLRFDTSHTMLRPAGSVIVVVPPDTGGADSREEEDVSVCGGVDIIAAFSFVLVRDWLFFGDDKTFGGGATWDGNVPAGFDSCPPPAKLRRTLGMLTKPTTTATKTPVTAILSPLDQGSDMRKGIIGRPIGSPIRSRHDTAVIRTVSLRTAHVCPRRSADRDVLARAVRYRWLFWRRIVAFAITAVGGCAAFISQHVR